MPARAVPTTDVTSDEPPRGRHPRASGGATDAFSRELSAARGDASELPAHGPHGNPRPPPASTQSPEPPRRDAPDDEGATRHRRARERDRSVARRPSHARDAADLVPAPAPASALAPAPAQVQAATAPAPKAPPDTRVDGGVGAASTSASTATRTSTPGDAAAEDSTSPSAHGSSASRASSHGGPRAVPAVTPARPSGSLVDAAAAPGRILRAATEPRAHDRDLAAAGGLARREPGRAAGEPPQAGRAPNGPDVAPQLAALGQPAPLAPTPAPTGAPQRAAAAPLPPMPVDWSAAGAVLGAAAHLRLSTDTLGDIALHLRLRDGAAHVRVEADAHAALEARAPELTRALAAEGIALGRLEVEPRAAPAPVAPSARGDDLGRAPSDGHGQPRRDDRSPDDAAPPTPAAPRARRARRPGHDVTA